MISRLRVGGVTLAVRSHASLAALRLPSRFAPFVPSRGADIDLRLDRRTVPELPARDLLFDSGGTWRVFRRDEGLLYVFRPPLGDGPPARAVAIDDARRRGTLFLPPSPSVRHRGFALSYPLDELLFQHHLARAGGLVLHACGVVVRGRAVLLLGHSGVGKTTLAGLFRRHAPEARVLSDDRVVVRRGRNGWRAYGTPWHGSGRFAEPRSGRLAAVCFLEQGSKTRLAPLPVSQAATRLVSLSFPPLWEAEGTVRSLRTASVLAKQVPAHHLVFARDPSPVTAVVAALRGRPRRG